MKSENAWSNTIPFRDFRVPYFSELFPEVAKALPLTGSERLLDLACGTGKLAFGFAPYVRSLTGIEAESPMLEGARQQSIKEGIKIELIQSTAEEMPNDIGPFEVVTIGKAHWFLDANTVIPKLDALLTENGKILVCMAVSESPWQSTFLRVRKKWSTSSWAPYVTPDAFFAGSKFGPSKRVVLTRRHVVSLDDLVKRAFAFRETSVESLGDKAAAFTSDLKQALLSFTDNHQLVETHINTGFIFSRK